MNIPVYDQNADVPIPAQKMQTIRDLESTERLTIQYDPDNYPDCKSAANALYEALKPVVEAYGQSHESEVFIRSPESTALAGYGAYWQVSWEAGPYEWAIVASLSWAFSRKHGWYTEPYYGFDLCFVES